MKKIFRLLVVLTFVLLLVGCNSDNRGTNDYNNDNVNEQQSCAAGWYENGVCCKAFSTGRYVDENGECPARSVPGYEVPGRGYAQNMCFTIHCN